MRYNSLQKRVLAIYIACIAIVAASFVSGFRPFAKGYQKGQALAAEQLEATFVNRMEEESSIPVLLMGVPVCEPLPVTIDTLSSPDVWWATTGEVTLMVSRHVDNPDFESVSSVLRNLLSLIGGSPVVYLLILSTVLIALAIIILLGWTLHSLYRSARNGEVFSTGNIRRIRTVGLLLIVNELCTAASKWSMARQAARAISTDAICIDTSFPLSYWNLLTGVLVILIAEIFAIGYKLSEEQKLTI